MQHLKRFWRFPSRIGYTCSEVRRVIGARLKNVREDNDETQADLAAHLGVGESTIRNWERERNSPDHDQLVQICKHYKVTSDYLLGLTRVDPLDLKRKQNQLDDNELADVRAYTEYLLWKRKHKK